MPRLPDPQDPVFQRLNSSLGFDRRLWRQDIAGSKAHLGALRKLEVIDDDELRTLDDGLDSVAAEIEAGTFSFQDSDEDIHMAVERRLTELVGPIGGALHTARSRNDQVATDLALYLREDRGTSISRRFFLRLMPPRIGLTGPCSIDHIVRLALARAHSAIIESHDLECRGKGGNQ